MKLSALDRTDGRRRNVAVARGVLLGIATHVRKHRSQILQIEQQPALVVGDLEYDRQHTSLDIVEIQNARQQQWPEIRNRGAQRMTLLAEGIPEYRGKAGQCRRRRADLRQAFL